MGRGAASGKAGGMAAAFVLLMAVFMVMVAAFPGELAAQEAGAAASDAWIITLGGSIVSAPTYEGARTNSPSFLPSFDIRRADEPATFSAPDDSFDFGLYDSNGFRFGVLAGIRDGRPQWVIPGVPGYSNALQAGGFAEFWPVDGHLRTRVELLQGLSADAGLGANLSADLVQKEGLFTFAFGPRLTLGDHTLMQTEFGVPLSAAVLNSSVTPYDADAGLKSMGLATSLSYDWSQDWSTTIFGSYQRLAGSAAQSPVVAGSGSLNQLSVGVGFEHSFVFGH